jgi:hypothetical protein
MQLDAVDLGNYLALQDGPKVKKPDLGDACAPSLSVGLAWGVSLPFVAAATVGWTPQFVLDRTQPTKRGTLNLGLTFGLHVPLIDLN